MTHRGSLSGRGVARRLAAAIGAILLAFAAPGQSVPTGPPPPPPAPAGPPAPSASLLTGWPVQVPVGLDRGGLRSMSLFALPTPEPRVFQKHDLVTVIVREVSTSRSDQELDTQKDWSMNGAIAAFPDFQLSELIQGILYAGRTTNMPVLDMNFDKDFQGDAEYVRADEFSARLTAEVLDVLPNGNLVLEARNRVKNDLEESVIRVTGICRPDDVTPANTILSNQLHDLSVEKVNSGEVKTGSSKGFLTKAFEAVFAF